jgi:energy-coupling factor transporter ATP-binding protein EcfA2
MGMDKAASIAPPPDEAEQDGAEQRAAPRFTLLIRAAKLVSAQGEFVCVIGHSGCGKSTLLNMVSGFATPSSGQVLLNGAPIQRPGPDRMVVFQGYALLPWMTAYENVHLAIDSVQPNISEHQKREIAMEHLAMVGLERLNAGLTLRGRYDAASGRLVMPAFSLELRDVAAVTLGLSMDGVTADAARAQDFSRMRLADARLRLADHSL